jgi:DNA-binding transcriptional regulator YiaG
MKQKTIGQRIVARRKERGQSREDLALHWHVALSTIRNWEIGLSEPTGDNLARVLRWLGDARTEAAK